MEDDKTYVVYCHTNKENGKKYIGITSNINKRWYGNGIGYIKNCSRIDGKKTAFGNAILKYGWESFDHEILKYNLTLDEANYWEAYYIDLYKTNVNIYGSKYGYNMTSGGDGTPGFKMPEYVIERRHDRKMSDETKEKIRESSRLHGVSKKCLEASNDVCRKPVVCVETKDYFISITEAAKSVNITMSDLASVCRGDRQSAAGLHWRYANEDDETFYNQFGNNHISDAERQEIINTSRTNLMNYLDQVRNTNIANSMKPILCVETGVIYPSLTLAADACNIDKRNISQCATGRTKTSGGYHWEYINKQEYLATIIDTTKE